MRNDDDSVRNDKQPGDLGCQRGGVGPHVIVPNTFQHQLFRGDCVNQAFIAAKKPLLKDTNKKTLAWAKKHEQWTLDRWKSVLGVMSPNLRFLVPTAVSL